MIDAVAFPDMDLQKLVYWTSSPYSASDGWYVDFHEGNLDNDTRKTTNSVRLVKGKP
jgi:hypothetical protein